MATKQIKIDHLICRNDVKSNWMLRNPILKLGEIGLETDTHKIKIGDGYTRWNNLNYIVVERDASGNYIETTYVKKDNPSFTVAPTAPTIPISDNSDKLATTSFVHQPRS